MFSGPRYVTRGVIEAVPLGVQLFLWSLVDALVADPAIEVDYLQVFELEAAVKGQCIIHRQEVPAYRAEYTFEKVEKPLAIKIYVIDDGEYAVMLLPEER